MSFQSSSNGRIKRVTTNTLALPVLLAVMPLAACSVIETTYHVIKGTVKSTIWAIKGTYQLTKGTTKLVYHIGKYTFEVIRAPLNYPLTHEDLETIDGLPAKEAIRQDRVKNAPYTVKGRQYVPMSLAEAERYEEKGFASWYGEETLRQGDHMTANGEVFNPRAFTAAHKYLPLPTHVLVTNLNNGRSIIVRVNDRGPFPSDHNDRSGERIIDLSWGAANELGFVSQGLARVRVEAIQLKAA
jgi:rare lipoprotein A